MSYALFLDDSMIVGLKAKASFFDLKKTIFACYSKLDIS